MASKKSSPKQLSQSKLKAAWQWPFRLLKGYWRKGWWQKLLTIGFTTLLICLAIMYGIARWYIWSERSKPFVLGVSFIPAYAESLGVDPQDTLAALTDDVGVRDFRLVSYWDQIELQPGTYDFSQLDWQFRKIESAHGHCSSSNASNSYSKVVEVVGRR